MKQEDENCLEYYKELIDSLVSLVRLENNALSSMKGQCFGEREFFNKFNDEEKDNIIELLKEKYIAGIHDALTHFDDMKIVYKNVELPMNPYFTMQNDFMSRLEGYNWGYEG
jgi:hypothetical protein